MISELAAEQLALVLSVREKWMPVCLSTEPADRAAAEEGLASAYELAGLTPPTMVVWMDSPLAGRMQAASLAVERERQRRLLDVDDESLKRLIELFEREGYIPQAGFDCGESVLSQLREGVQGEIDRRLRAQVGHDLWVDVRDSLMDRRVSAETHMHAHQGFNDQVNEVLGIAAGDVVPRALYELITVYGGDGQHDAWWLAFCEFFEQIGLLENTESLKPFRQLAASGGAWWAFENAAVLCERPSVLRLDEWERPHSESGPAVEYRDGFGFYAWRGVRVPAGTVIDVDSLTVEAIDAESNGMLRPVLIDAFGEDRYLSAKGATLLHEERRWGNIYRVTAERECTALHEMGSCSFLAVPPYIQTGRQAWAWHTGQELNANDNSTHSPFGVG